MPTGRYPWLRELIRTRQMLSLSGNPAAVPPQAIRFTDHISEPTSWVVVPLVSERRLVGFFELKSPLPQELSPSEQELAQNVANAVAESINATQLFPLMRSTTNDPAINHVIKRWRVRKISAAARNNAARPSG